jgi:hypothetical protein
MLHIRLRVLPMHRGALGWAADLLATVVVGISVLASGRLRYVGLHRHATRDDVGRRAAPGRILGRSGATEALRELLAQRLSDVIHGNVNRISYS